MLGYQASLQLCRKHRLYCELSKAWAGRRAGSHAPCGHGSSSVDFPPSGTVDCPREGHCGEINLNCFIAVVFFISEIVLFNILNKIDRKSVV